MADLPTINDLGAMPSGRSGRIVARFDTTPIGEGLEGFGDSVTGFANAVGQVQQARDAQAQARAQAQAQQTQQRYALHKADEGTLQAALASGLTAATAPSHADDYIAGYQQRSNALLDTMPPDLREHYAGRMEADGHGLYRQAVQAGQGAIKKAATASVADATSAASAQADVAGAHPDPAARLQMLQGAISDGATAIALTPRLGDDEKAQATAALRTAVQTRFARALPPADAVTLAPGFARESTVDGIMRLLNDPASPPPQALRLLANENVASPAGQPPTASAQADGGADSVSPTAPGVSSGNSAGVAASGQTGQPTTGPTQNTFSGYGAALAAAPPESANYPAGVNWDFIKTREGGDYWIGYVPPAGKAVKSPTSGVTIAAGFDLGNRSVADLQALGLPDDLVANLTPYLGLKGQDAQAHLDQHPLIITTEQMQKIDDIAFNDYYNTVASKYNAAATNGLVFQNLPQAAQTAIVDIFYALGKNIDTAKPPHGAPDLWRQVTTGQWQQAADNLHTWVGADTGRRHAEGDLLLQAFPPPPPVPPLPHLSPRDP